MDGGGRRGGVGVELRGRGFGACGCEDVEAGGNAGDVWGDGEAAAAGAGEFADIQGYTVSRVLGEQVGGGAPEGEARDAGSGAPDDEGEPIERGACGEGEVGVGDWEGGAGWGGRGDNGGRKGGKGGFCF